MAANLDAFTQKVIQEEQIQSVLVLQQPNRFYPLDGIDLLYLIIVNSAATQVDVSQLVFEEKNLLVYRISQWQLETCAIQGEIDERLRQMLVYAETVWDKNQYISKFSERLQKHVAKRKKYQVCVEYSGFLRHYNEAKELLHRHLTLDAYQAVIIALQKWARLVICESCEMHDLSLWARVKQLDPSVYKLYEELITSQEPLEKRIELMLLPIEVNVMSKLKSSTQLLVDVMQTENRPWFLQELKRHPDLEKVEIDLQMLLDKMVKRGLLYEVAVLQEAGQVAEKGYLATAT
ncbi:hypothetical protein EDM56_00625 [Brevibacillus fluminis]|uniref:Nucleotidyltransferase-like domain-containing protein n=1 Tax=Brevibacillus fluminis TaxID=511487 RepID=A0A3M8DYD6_9BACL|nr:nucleotidyltransferase-like protein [Brevibacillus fluminis]RNB92241.1 hypothetical protein EDM56_00625 [Brevibacillus fluminis]